MSRFLYNLIRLPYEEKLNALWRIIFHIKKKKITENNANIRNYSLFSPLKRWIHADQCIFQKKKQLIKYSKRIYHLVEEEVDVDQFAERHIHCPYIRSVLYHQQLVRKLDYHRVTPEISLLISS